MYPSSRSCRACSYKHVLMRPHCKPFAVRGRLKSPRGRGLQFSAASSIPSVAPFRPLHCSPRSVSQSAGSTTHPTRGRAPSKLLLDSCRRSFVAVRALRSLRSCRESHRDGCREIPRIAPTRIRPRRARRLDEIHRRADISRSSRPRTQRRPVAFRRLSESQNTPRPCRCSSRSVVADPCPA